MKPFVSSLGCAAAGLALVAAFAAEAPAITPADAATRAAVAPSLTVTYPTKMTTTTIVNHAPVISATVDCPTGAKAVGGGWDKAGDGGYVSVSKPTADDSGWVLERLSITGQTLNARVYAVCLAFSPGSAA